MGALNELQVRDRLMRHFIKTDPIYVALHRPTFATTEAGGKKKVGEDTLAPQEFHVYPFKRRLTQEYFYTPQTLGEEKVEKILWIVIFDRATADIEVNDYFFVPTDCDTDRLRPGEYTVEFISARLWDRGQAGFLYRG